ncbi:MAG: translation initiation factor IF-3 [Thermodesulfobacteriota bacterium]
MNQRIRAKEVRVVAADGKQVGIIPTYEALKMAEEQGVDLVEVAPNANPPVCRLMDFGKYKYELKKQAAAKKQRGQTLKEVKFRPNIGEHDLDVKINHIREFLEDGDKAKIRIFFRGREITHYELGRALADKIVERVSDIGAIDLPPKLEGKNLITVISPKKKS